MANKFFRVEDTNVDDPLIVAIARQPIPAAGHPIDWSFFTVKTGNEEVLVLKSLNSFCPYSGFSYVLNIQKTELEVPIFFDLPEEWEGRTLFDLFVHTLTTEEHKTEYEHCMMHALVTHMNEVQIALKQGKALAYKSFITYLKSIKNLDYLKEYLHEMLTMHINVRESPKSWRPVFSHFMLFGKFVQAATDTEREFYYINKAMPERV